METLERSLYSQSPLQSQIFQQSSHNSTLDSKITPSILLIIIILAIIFFISGLLHLLVRFLLKPNSRNPDELDDVTVLQGQLQQLFYLHDSGVDQSFIDTLPLFHYKSIIGVKDPFDCAVCLCEFEPDDRLRLLPKCSHAFHTDCIDTWLLSHSTCPLCRSNLLDGFSRSSRIPIVCVLESGSDAGDEEISGFSDRNLGFVREVESGSSRRKSSEITVKEDEIVTVKLGKFRNVDESGESSTTNNSTNNNNVNVVNSRRCFSMGSFAYVMDENSSLQVPIRTPAKKESVKKSGFYKSAISEYGCDSRRGFSGNVVDKVESFSVSKNHGNVSLRWENGGDEETQSCYSVESTTTNVSTTRRTLLWLMGRQQNKVVHSSLSSSSNV